jgi:hypothetical protein
LTTDHVNVLKDAIGSEPPKCKDRALVIGKGVLGLSLAHQLAKMGRAVTLIYSNAKTPGSCSAAANLSLKSQQFGRDPHFQLKIEGRVRFESWLDELALPVRFRRGLGIETFEDAQQAQQHFQRIQQPTDELEKRSLPTQNFSKLDDKTFVYQDEAWVHAGDLLAALEATCLKLGVQFVEKNISNRDEIEAFLNTGKALCLKNKISIFLCTGWGSIEILNNLNLRPCSSRDQTLVAKPRMSVGSTFTAHSQTFDPIGTDSEVAIQETHKGTKTQTLSGDSSCLFLSSTSLRVPHDVIDKETNLSLLQETNSNFLNAFETKNTEKWTVNTGMRLGFGHSELLCCALESSSQPTFRRWYFMAGAHKSGFLYAAAMPQLLKSLYSE